jgi:hypothetical protein
MGLISRAWTNLAPPGAMSEPDELTRSPVVDRTSPTRKGRPRTAAKFDADWRFSGHHTPYVSRSDMKNAIV